MLHCTKSCCTATKPDYISDAPSHVIENVVCFRACCGHVAEKLCLEFSPPVLSTRQTNLSFQSIGPRCPIWNSSHPGTKS